MFVSFDDLKQLSFKKLERVCDKVFVFVHENIEAVPFSLVRDMQKMGNNVKWITITGNTLSDMSYQICFLMGKLHEKMSADIEFAILSNDPTFDPLVTFINSTGRSCIRVQQKENGHNNENTHNLDPLSKQPRPLITEEELAFQTVTKNINTDMSSAAFYEMTPASQSFPAHFSEEDTLFSPNAESFVQNNNIQYEDFMTEAALETVRRLIRSGNRPSEISILKNYILLHHRDEKIHRNIGKIIEYLEYNNNITINETEVIYHF
jgi:hypothetical protein